jgi:glycerophosphoryl diester phosphodiesterase
MSGHNSFVPEHSKAAYALGASYGATYIEPDVISTKDHVLLVMHGNELSRTSDVADKPEFADRKTTKVIDDGDGSGKSTITGFFSEDFTWEEIQVSDSEVTYTVYLI